METTAEFTVVVEPATPPPSSGSGSGSGSGPTALAIVDATEDGVLVPMQEGVPTNQPVCNVIGGVPPYSYEFSGQPQGVTFEETTNEDGSATVSTTGTPEVGSAAGSPYTIDVTVTDSATPPATASAKRAIG
jgi:hypothetical protein